MIESLAIKSFGILIVFGALYYFVRKTILLKRELKLKDDQVEALDRLVGIERKACEVYKEYYIQHNNDPNAVLELLSKRKG